LVLSEFVVGLEDFVLDFDFLEVEIRGNLDVFDLEFKGETSFDEISWVEDLDEMGGFFKPYKSATL
jgi:hypothetical protein